MVSPVRLSTVISPTPVTTPPAPARLSPEPPPRHTARPAGGPPGAASLRQTVPSSLGDSGVETRASSQHVANHESEARATVAGTKTAGPLVHFSSGAAPRAAASS